MVTQLGYSLGHKGTLSKKGEVPFDTWSCWESQVDAEFNEWRFWIDGVEHASISGPKGTPSGTSTNQTQSWPVPVVTSMHIGVNDSEEILLEAWFDNIVLSTVRVGCDPAAQ
jgi:hypothetical protein